MNNPLLSTTCKIGAQMMVEVADQVPIPQLPPNPAADDLLRITLANQQKLKPLMHAYLLASMGDLPDKEKIREKAHEVVEIVLDQIAAYAKKVISS